jgi:iron complex outermembrane receptor protein
VVPSPFARRARAALSVLALGMQLAAHAQPPAPDQLPPVAVTANPLGSALFDLVTPVAVMSGERLLLNTQPTLGEIVNEMLGINSSYYGPNASRPVIRGLDGDRVQILQNGMQSFDASGTSVDHAVAIDTLTVKRIEVVRGPAVLLYGPTAIGGVVNVIDSRIPFEKLTGVTGGIDARYASPANERAVAGALEFGLPQGLQFHVDGFTRKTSDLRIADYAYSPQLRATLPPDEQGPQYRLPNSASSSDGGSIGAAYVGAQGFVGASYTDFSSDYGTVAEPDVTIQMRQSRTDVAAQYRPFDSTVKSVDFKFTYTKYEHTEYEGSEPGTVFKNDGGQGRLDLVHNKIGPFEGAVGVAFVDFDFSALGDEGFLPKTNTRSFAAFIYEEARVDRWKFLLGARYDYTRVGADEEEKFGPALTRNFNSGALSAGVSYNLAQDYALVGSLAYTQRPPNYQELFADGPHIATGIVEIGDRTLSLEKSWGVDVALRKRGERWTGSVGAFYNRFSNYITLYDSGFVDPEDELPIYYYRGGAAEFYGVEAEANITLGRYGPGMWSLELKADYLRGTNTDLDAPLPRISPVRFGGALVYNADAWNARLDVYRVQSQDRVAPNELPTDGYTMLNASLLYQLTKGRYGLTAFVKGTNLLNEDARNHVSYLVNIAPMGARGVTAGIRGTF